MNSLTNLIPLPYRILALALFAVALMAFGWIEGVQHEEVKFDLYRAKTTAEQAQASAKAAQALATQTGLVLTLERKLATNLAEQEKKDAANQSTVAGLSAQLRTARAVSGGRLRDPNATACAGSGPAVATESGASGSAGDPAQTGGLFSAGATELLERLTREADDINVAYASCREDALKLRLAAPP